MFFRILPLFCILHSAGLVAGNLLAAEPLDKPPPLAANCAKCHADLKFKGGLVPGSGQAVAGNIPSVMSSRMGAPARSAALTRNGANERSEEAVLRGLRWLVRNQNFDGSWSTSFKGAMTGFGLLCFLGHGETAVSPEFGPTVQRAIGWLTSNGEKFDARLSMRDVFDQQGVYQHAIGAYALSEYYSLTKDERVLELLKKAVGYIVDGQSPDGGWVYGYAKDGDGDTSVSGWQIQALRAAHLTGLNIAGVDAALDHAMLDLKRVQGRKGGFGYRGPQEKYSLTGVGVLCTYLWKQEIDKSVSDGIEFMMKETDKDFPVEYMSDRADLYAWYYNTQASFMAGGGAWDKWNSLIQPTIIRNQSLDGSWPPMAARGVGNLQSDPASAGPFYRTSLCILMLEVYYRFVPPRNRLP